MPLYDIVISSPTIETGISINCIHFTSVWGIFQGVQTPDSCRQALSRIRDSVPRYVWARGTGFNRIAGGSTSAKSILFSQHKTTQAHVDLLRKADFNDEIDTEFHYPSLLTWAKKAAVVNLGMKNYQTSIFQGLQEEGHFIIDVANDQEKAEITKTEIKENKKVEYQAHCEAVANIESPTLDELKDLKEKQCKTEVERLKFEKGSIEELYKIPVTPELVKKNDDKWHPKLRLHYYLSEGAMYLSDRDTNIMRKMLEVGEGSIFKPDLNNSLLGVKIATLKILDFNKFFEKREFSGNDSDVQEIANKCKKDAFNIKSILGITINQKDSPMAILQQLAGLIGYRFPFLRQERNGESQRIRVYGYPAADFERDSEGAILKDDEGQAIPLSDGREEVFSAWLAQDEAKAAALADAQASIKRMKGEASILGTGVIKDELSITEAVPNEVVLHSDLGTGVIKDELSIIGGVPDDDFDESREEESDLVRLTNFLALVESFEQFTVAVEGQLPEDVEAAIALQNTQPKRNQLKEWWKPQRQLPTVEFIEEALPLQQELTYTNQGEGAVDSPETSAKPDALSEEWLQPETLEDIAATLEVCPNQEDLAMLRGAFPANALQLAAKLLPPKKRSQIKQWVTNLNKIASKITLGSLCTYIGDEYRLMRLCQAKKLEVISIQGKDALVRSEGWYDSITHRIPLPQLKLTT